MISVFHLKVLYIHFCKHLGSLLLMLVKSRIFHLRYENEIFDIFIQVCFTGDEI